MKIRESIIACLAAAALLPAAGCIVMDDPCVTCPDSSGSDGAVHIGFSVSASGDRHFTASGLTRADSQGHPEEVGELPIENEINLDDFAFYIFVGEGADSKSHQLLYYNYNINDPAADDSGIEMSVTGGSGEYSVSVSMPRTLIEKHLGHELASTAGLTMRILLLANSTAGTPPSGTTPGSSGVAVYKALPHIEGKTTFSELIDVAKGLKFKTSDLFDTDNTEVGVVADKVVQGTIPMFGTSVVKISYGALLDSRPYEPIYLGEVSLLRSVAKVRVHDAITGQVDGYPRLYSSKITYAVPEAYMLPADAADYVNGSQVHTTNIVVPPDGSKSTTLNMPYVSDAKKVFVAYMPEQKIAAYSSPMLEVKVQTGKNATSINTYYIDFKGYGGQDFNWDTDDNILRNHIYDIKVEYIRDIGITLDVTVCPMDKAEIVIPPFE